MKGVMEATQVLSTMTDALQVYEVPNLHLEGHMCRTNLMPRTIVRGPGFLNAVMIMEQVSGNTPPPPPPPPPPLGQSQAAPRRAVSGSPCFCLDLSTYIKSAAQLHRQVDAVCMQISCTMYAQ